MPDTGRQCGDCTLCCTVLFVPEIDKQQDDRCVHCRAQCSIYESRPKSCVDFKCEWLKGALTEDMRPDKSHVVLEKLPNVPVVLALFEPGYGVTDELTPQLEPYQSEGISVAAKEQALLAEGATAAGVMADIRAAAREMGVIR